MLFERKFCSFASISHAGERAYILRYEDMKHNYTIGFDAKYANADTTRRGNYSRFIIRAIASACPENAYFRLYTPKRLPNAEYDQLEELQNVESMEPDGSLWRKLSWFWQFIRVTKDAKRGDVELYHGLANRLPFGLARRDIRSVVTIHDLMHIRYPKQFNIFERIIRDLEIRSACHRADRIVATSEATKRDLAHLMGLNHEKIDVVYEGCNPIYNTPISLEEVEAVKHKYELPERYILNIGDMVERKNIGLIIEAMAELPNDVELVVVGKPTSYTKRIKRRIKSLGIESRVHFLRNVALNDRPALYRGAEMFIYPSKFEGFAIEILEALSAGVPVIAARGSSLEEAGGEGSIYVSAKDCGELVEAIEQLRREPELRTKMIKLGRRHVKMFRSEVAAYSLVKCYRRIGIDISE